jgi:[acyl-carrier-protein] S-malonyltransferase
MADLDEVKATIDDAGGGGAVVFPGQGVDAAAIRADLGRYEDDPLVLAMTSMLGTRDPKALDFTDTRVAQPCIFVAGLLNARQRFPVEELRAVMGHSLGEITTLCYAGAVDDEAALDLVRLRGELCYDVNQRRPGEMAAVMGLSQQMVEWVRRAVVTETGKILEVAAINGRQQVVLSGEVGTIDRVVEHAARLNGLVQRLPIGGSFHSGVMLEVEDAFGSAIAGIDWRDPVLPVVSTIDGGVHESWKKPAELLVKALTLPVLWLEGLKALAGLGVKLVWDAGPGETLRKLGHRDRLVKFA